MDISEEQMREIMDEAQERIAETRANCNHKWFSHPADGVCCLRCGLPADGNAVYEE